MNYGRAMWMAASIGFGLLVSASAGFCSPDPRTFAGSVVDVNKATDTIVVADVGPLLPSGTSEVAQRRVHVTPSTQFARVDRAQGAAPSGWVGAYVETALPQWEVKPGDFVSITVTPGTSGGAEAVKVTVVGAGAELPAALPPVTVSPSEVRR